ncbi:hypothetical protein [Pontibacter vulgaris]|uniref:hypothetical protein n=1 Tax=Pontibacter vulgaris TaxID=2905679 RepID=UPI001FA761FE|nr:hypothetical protein [Pontibacter vulgaris]
MNIDFLDRVLLYMKEHTSFSASRESVPEFKDEDDELLATALQKLEKDGYVYTTTSVFKSGNTNTTYHISYDGLLALESCPNSWRNRPYRWGVQKEKLNGIWSITKIVAVVVNALIVLIFTYLTYFKE